MIWGLKVHDLLVISFGKDIHKMRGFLWFQMGRKNSIGIPKSLMKASFWGMQIWSTTSQKHSFPNANKKPPMGDKGFDWVCGINIVVFHALCGIKKKSILWMRSMILCQQLLFYGASQMFHVSSLQITLCIEYINSV